MYFEEKARGKKTKETDLLLGCLNHLLSWPGLFKGNASQNQRSKLQKKQKQNGYLAILISFVIE